MSELETIQPMYRRKCEFREVLLGRLAKDKVMQFVNGLNDKYEAIRNQIL